MTDKISFESLDDELKQILIAFTKAIPIEGETKQKCNQSYLVRRFNARSHAKGLHNPHWKGDRVQLNVKISRDLKRRFDLVKGEEVSASDYVSMIIENHLNSLT